MASVSRTQPWNYDPLGNFNSQTTDGNAQTHTASQQNEIASVRVAATPTYDSNGNMTTDETDKQLLLGLLR